MATIDDYELIPREALFGNPERAGVQISPDGRYLSWLAPREGVLNVWVVEASGDIAEARPVTDDRARGIRTHVWSHRPDILLYLRDSGGDEDFHLHLVDVGSGKRRDLAPYERTTARIVAVSHLRPDSILVAMNDRDAQWHDLYEVDLASGERVLLEENTHEIAGYVADAHYRLRYALRSRPDGSEELLVRGWRPLGRARDHSLRGHPHHRAGRAHHRRGDPVSRRLAGT